MLRVDVRELRHGPVPTDGTIPARDPLFEGLGLDLAAPLMVSGILDTTARDDYFWRGDFAGRIRTACRRCLREIEIPVSSKIEVLFSADPEMQDDPSVYPLPEPPTHVDVREAVREELALAAPGFALCREDCKGLCPTCGADLNLGPCQCGTPTTN